MLLNEVYYIRYFIIRAESALHSNRLGKSLWIIEHIALTQQLLSANHIKNGSRIHAGSYRESNSARHIRLDQTCNDINRRSLSCNHKMNSCRSCQLCQSTDGFFYFIRRYHHQICKLVYDNHKLRHLLNGDFDLFTIIHDLHLTIMNLVVIALHITNTSVRKLLITIGHLCNSPLKRCGSPLWICNNRYQKMRNSVINRKFYNLGIDHDEFYLFRLRVIEDTHDNGVNTNRLTGTGCTGYQKVRHLCNIRDNNLSTDILTNCKSNSGFCSSKFIRFYKISECNHLCFLIGDFDTDDITTRNRCFNSNICSCQVHLNIICQIHDTGNLHTNRRFEFISGYCRTIHIRDITVNGDTEIVQCVLQAFCSLPVDATATS